jgi:hypothetical protein
MGGDKYIEENMRIITTGITNGQEEIESLPSHLFQLPQFCPTEVPHEPLPDVF